MIGEKQILKLHNKIENIYEKNPKKYGFFCVYYFIIELILKRYFDKLIFTNLLTQNTIIEFLDKNEFGFKNNVLYKKDIIDENTFYGEMKNIEIEKLLKSDFEKILLQEINDSYITIDVENYINIFVTVESDKIKNLRIYSIYIRYYRNEIINITKSKVIKRLVIYFITLLIILFGYFYFLKY